ncbi:hypothetical protein EDB80DRAFT_755359 [Ilyonectria destructans]|nr:hypothetical protein EDB80DRAFT_755359 [Ilyonectria destructans]
MPATKVKSRERRRCARACGNCKRRKERCDGQFPCGRCSTRQVVDQCSFARSPRTPNPPVSSLDCRSVGRDDLNIDCANVSASRPAPLLNGDPAAMPIRDSANLSFFHVVRHLAHTSLGASVFAEDAPETLIEETPTQPPRRPDPADARYLVQWYLRATNCVLILLDAEELHNALSEWLQNQMDQEKQQAMTPILFLIFAIGSQTCPENRDDIAEKYFNYGRSLTLSQNMEKPSVPTIQAHALITMYQLGASRRDAAFMYSGIAVRAGYTLGIHRTDVNAQYAICEYTARERLWKVLRVLDLFMSASLGHPPSTCETRDTAAEANYSASNDLCAIFESILNGVYLRRTVSKDALERISEHHRQWTKRFTTGLAADDIKSTEFIDTDEGKRAPNIGLYHLKEAYYWTIMLLARPFLVESVVSKTMVNDSPAENGIADTSLSRIVSYACVDAAIRTVDLLSGLRSSENIPKRLPFVVNCLFVASLVLGLAQFGDFDFIFPVGKSLARARKLLAFFSRYDVGSKRNLAVVDDLRAACDLHIEKRFRRKMEKHSLLIRGLFGLMHDNSIPQRSVPDGADDLRPWQTSSYPFHQGQSFLIRWTRKPSWFWTPMTALYILGTF